MGLLSSALHSGGHSLAGSRFRLHACAWAQRSRSASNDWLFGEAGSRVVQCLLCRNSLPGSYWKATWKTVDWWNHREPCPVWADDTNLNGPMGGLYGSYTGYRKPMHTKHWRRVQSYFANIHLVIWTRFCLDSNAVYTWPQARLLITCIGQYSYHLLLPVPITQLQFAKHLK